MAERQQPANPVTWEYKIENLKAPFQYFYLLLKYVILYPKPLISEFFNACPLSYFYWLSLNYNCKVIFF